MGASAKRSVELASPVAPQRKKTYRSVVATGRQAEQGILSFCGVTARIASLWWRLSASVFGEMVTERIARTMENNRIVVFTTVEFCKYPAFLSSTIKDRQEPTCA